MADPSPDAAALKALRRLATEPAGRRIYGKGQPPGLFPTRSAAAGRTVSALEQDRLIEIDGLEPASARITAAGRDALVAQDVPKELLEDLLRVAEAQQERLSCLVDEVDTYRQQLTALRELVAAVLGGASSPAGPDEDVLAVLQARADAPGATTLSDLHAALRRGGPVSVGQLHDALRRLSAAGAVRLSPWTGPLYELPDPSLALLIGHEVLYYAALRQHP